MNKHFNIKNLVLIAFMFVCFFAFNGNVKAEKITCNYNLSGPDSTNVKDDVVLTFDKDGSKINVQYNINIGTTIISATTGFTPKDINNTCPKNLYQVDTGDYSDMRIKLFASKDSAKSGSTGGLDYKNRLQTLQLNNTNDYSSMSTCEYKEYLEGTKNSVTGNKITIYYKKNSSETPIIKYNDKDSSSTIKYVANFKGSDIKNCPYQVYSASSNKNDYGNSTTIETRTFYLSEDAVKKASKKYTTYGNEKYGSSDDKNSGAYVIINDNTKNTKDNSIEARCAKIEGIKKYISWTYNLLRFAIPLLIVVLSTVEFVGVVLSGEDEKMEKAKKHFIIRLVIGVVAILVPYLLEFILRLGGIIHSDLSDIACNIIKK